MVIEALQSYAQLASGLTKTTREKAMATAKGLLDQAGLGDVASDAGDRVTKLADELIATSKANRQLLTKFVDAEVQKAVGKLGLAKSEDIDDLRAEIAALRATNAAAVASTATASASAPPAAAPTAAPAARRPAKKAPAKKAAPPATAAESATAESAAATTAQQPAKKAPARKAPVKKATAKKSTATKAPAKKAAAATAATPSSGDAS